MFQHGDPLSGQQTTSPIRRTQSPRVVDRASSLSNELRARDERAVFRGDSPDAAVSVVAARVAEIDFAVLDDRVVPVGNVDRSVRSHLHVDRAERDVIRFDQLHLLARAEAGYVFVAT